jgi:hypothetical protein
MMSDEFNPAMMLFRTGQNGGGHGHAGPADKVVSLGAEGAVQDLMGHMESSTFARTVLPFITMISAIKSMLPDAMFQYFGQLMTPPPMPSLPKPKDAFVRGGGGH